MTDTHRKYWPATKQWHFKLTVRKADGHESTFRVKRSVWRACDKGDAYPACAS
ncbi:hypothetical protein ACN2WE_05255 [Streptomyces sp. cg28]|uniref:hypothetical protein n=1 Tax=Streptomyces sp. cg28 TaxID=3403457 RepID=UPI003B220F1C